MVAVALPPTDDITTAILTWLRTGNWTVYDGAYTGDPEKPTYPYRVLYRIPGGSSDPLPVMDDPRTTVTLAYQVTHVSNLRNQCERAARDTHARLLARDATTGRYASSPAMPTGWVLTRREPDLATPGIDRVGDHPRAVFNLPARYLLTVTPNTPPEY